MKVIVPDADNCFVSLVKRDDAEAISGLLKNAKFFQLGKGLANLKCHFDLSRFFQVLLNKAVQFFAGNAFWICLTPKNEIRQKRFTALLVFRFVKQAKQYAGVVIKILEVEALRERQAIALL